MLASLAQNFSNKLKEPLLPTHLATFLFTIIVLASVPGAKFTSEGKETCGFNGDGTCSMGAGLGGFSLVLSLAFIAIELNWDSERLVAHHRYIYLGELGVACVFAFLFAILWVMELSGVSSASQSMKDAVGSGRYAGAIISTLLAGGAWGFLAYLSRKGYKEDDIGGIERLTTRGGGGGGGGYLDPVTSAYHGATMYESSNDPPVP